MLRGRGPGWDTRGVHITDLEPSQVDEAAELAAAAYAEDPIFQAVFSTAKRRRAFHLTEQGITLRQHDPARVVRVAIDGGAVVGVAIWKTDGAGGGVPGELDRRAEKLLRTFFRKLGADRQPYARFAVALRAAMPMDPDVFLAQLAVRPDRQREGSARRSWTTASPVPMPESGPSVCRRASRATWRSTSGPALSS
nr:hypothetical protein GCM10025730_45760 [Promicromonospora thailandica]